MKGVKCNIIIITQCTDMQKAIAFALIRFGKISDRRRPGTGPAPIANEKTNLHTQIAIYFHLSVYHSILLPFFFYLLQFIF